MTERQNASTSPLMQGIGRLFRFLVRMIFIFTIGALIGLGLYYGVPWLYRRLILPVQENSARLAVLEARVGSQQERIAENHRVLQGRVAEVDTDLARLREDISAQGQVQQTLEEQSQQLAQRLAQVELDLEETASSVGEEVDEIQEQLGETQAELNRQIENTDVMVTDLETQIDRLTGRLTLLQTAQDLLKVRLLLLEENTGAARDAVALAVAHLDRASALIPPQAEDLEDLRERMLALDELIAEDSFRVRPDLEALWADVMDLVVPLGAQSAMTTTRSASPVATSTPSP